MYRPLPAVALILFACVVEGETTVAHSAGKGLLLAGETIRFDASLRPQFTPQQLSTTAASTRAGLVRWAATDEGRSIIARFRSEAVEVEVIESSEEPGIGRAPQPGFATLLAASDATRLKRYQLIVNPSRAAEYRGQAELDLGLPRTPADVMAAAWAAEMLHIEFYSRGIPLPHHERSEFQERWLAVAAQLGLARLEHGTEVEQQHLPRRRSGRRGRW